MSTEALIQIDKLTFEYKTQPIFADFNLAVPGDQFIGLIGSNGSGKSTLLKLLTGRLKANKGQVLVLNRAPGSFANKFFVGSSFQEIDFPGTEKVEEILMFVCKQYPKAFDPEKLIIDFNLTEFRKKACGQLSGGMKRRLALACAFAGQPDIVLLDEPTTGLDLPSRKALVRNIKAYQASHHALVIMISHHPDEVMESVDQFFHIKKGTLQRVSTDRMRELAKIRKIQFDSSENQKLPEALKAEFSNGRYTILSTDSDQWIADLSRSDVSFNNLLISPLGSEELLQEVL